MKLIPLTKGQFAKVSDHRYEHLMQWKWHARWNDKSQTFYASRNQNIAATGDPWKNSMVSMHRYILGLKRGDVGTDGKLLQGMHGDGDGLNNQDENLTIGNNSKNAMDRKPIMANNTSGHKGVYFIKTSKAHPWATFVKVNGKQRSCGRYGTYDEAVTARKAAEIEHYGKLCRKE